MSADMYDRNVSMQDVLNIRGVHAPCKNCHGWGTKTYGSTATWRGGIGGQALTVDVCDQCWGSGDENRHWPSQRAGRSNPEPLEIPSVQHRAMMNAIRHFRKNNNDMRFGQWLWNTLQGNGLWVAPEANALYFIEDDVLVKMLEDSQ